MKRLSSDKRVLCGLGYMDPPKVKMRLVGSKWSKSAWVSHLHSELKEHVGVDVLMDIR